MLSPIRILVYVLAALWIVEHVPTLLPADALTIPKQTVMSQWDAEELAHEQLVERYETCLHQHPEIRSIDTFFAPNACDSILGLH